MRAEINREALLMLVLYTKRVQNVKQVHMVKMSAIVPKPDTQEKKWSAHLPFTDSEDGLSLFLSLTESAAHLALWKLTKGWVIREYSPAVVEFETAL